MQRHVLHHPEYVKRNSQKQLQSAYNGDKEAEDFCMVNYPTCRLEMKAFYLLKTIEGDTRYTHENLLKFDDFDEFLPLF